MSRFLSLLAALTVGTSVIAQVSIRINADPAALKALARRTLMVELPEVNPKVSEGFSKKTRDQETAAYTGGDASKAVLFSIPVGTITSQLLLSITQFTYEKLILDPATGKIISAYVPGMGKSVAKGLMKMDFKAFSDCD